jgi:hypothetical protein
MDDALPTMFCDKLIKKFEENEDDVQVVTEGPKTTSRHFIEVNISQHWQDEHDMFVQYVQQAAKVYMNLHRIQYDIQWPRQYGYEQFRMKRYLPNGRDEFAIHTDVGSHASARRFLAFLWYLNTVQEGGQTRFGFTQESPVATVPAVRGRLLVFPPLWTHPHWGCKTISGPKYIVSGYLHLI